MNQESKTVLPTVLAIVAGGLLFLAVLVLVFHWYIDWDWGFIPWVLDGMPD